MTTKPHAILSLEDALDFLNKFKIDDAVFDNPKSKNSYKSVFSVSDKHTTVKFMSDANEPKVFFEQLQNKTVSVLNKIIVSQYGRTRIVYEKFNE